MRGMNFDLQTTSTEWIGYAILIACVGYLFILICQFVRVMKGTDAKLVPTWNKVRIGLWMSCCIFVILFFSVNMFWRFHRVQVSDAKVILFYQWPRGATELSGSSIHEVVVIKDRRGTGQIVIRHKAGTAKSITCPRSADLEAVRQAMMRSGN